MVAINFSARFADDVEHGAKRQTIRRTALCKPGDPLHLYTGQGTENCRKLAEVTCLRVTPVELGDTGMKLDGIPVFVGDARRGDYFDCDNDFARKGGFDGYLEMADWFRNYSGALPFTGFVIEWSEPR